MRIKSEDEILKPEVRKKIIEEIEGPENKRRKEDHFVRHQVFKDQTKYFVIKKLEKQFDQNTLKEMEYAFSNISICRKIISKLARVYNSGVKRTVTNEEGKEVEEETQKVNELEKELCINNTQKTLNKYLKLHRNTVQYIKPCPYVEDGKEFNKLKLQVLAPYLYDAVEDYYDRTKPLCYVLSNYEFNDLQYSSLDAAREGRTFDSQLQPPISDKKDQLIADEKTDEGQNKKEYIWWSGKYHFTTDCHGDIISGEGTENPIKKLPIINYAIDQDNSFWAEGGQDIAEGAILLNAMLSHLNHISVNQGYGQFWMKGKNLPRNVTLGPTKAVLMEYGEDEKDPVPDIGFANANANLAGMMQVIEMYTALLLTTNNLSTSGVQTQLGGGSAFPSAIAMFIDKAESMEDVQDQQQVFLDNEPEMFEVISEWIKLYTQEGSLCPELEGLELPEEFNMNIQFNEVHVMQTEAEKLANIKLRKDLGINTMIDLIKKDQPDLSDQEAEEKLKKILEEKMQRMDEMMGKGLSPDGKPMPNGSTQVVPQKDKLNGGGKEDERNLDEIVQ